MYEDVKHHTPIFGYDAGLTDMVGNPISIIATGLGWMYIPKDIKILREAFTQLMHALKHVKNLKEYNTRMTDDIRVPNLYCSGIAVYAGDNTRPIYDIQNHVEMIREPYHATAFGHWLWKQKYKILGDGWTRDPFFYENKVPLLYVRCDFDLTMSEDEVNSRRDMFANNATVSRIYKEYETDEIIGSLLKIYNEFEIGDHIDIEKV